MDMESGTFVGKCPRCGGNNYKRTWTPDKDNPMKFYLEQSCDDCNAFKVNTLCVSEDEYHEACAAKGLLDKTEE